MDDHVYEQVMSYAECELLPRFREECKHSRKITECTSLGYAPQKAPESHREP